MGKFQNMVVEATSNVKGKFRFATLNFLFIMLFITVVQNIFGGDNSIVAVIFVQIMLSTMNRDTSATPFKSIIIQAIVLMMMGVGSCIVVNIPPIYGFAINAMIMFILLYAYTFEYMDCLYFPYILSYLFFVCLAPISFSQLPLRLELILFGAIAIIMYQWIVGRHRIKETTKSVLLKIIEEADHCIHDSLHQHLFEEDYQALRSEICKLSKLIYDRRKSTLCISDAAFATLNVARGLESLVMQLSYENKELTPLRKELFYQITYYLSCFKSFVLQEREELLAIDFSHLPTDEEEVVASIEKLSYIREHLLDMKKKDKKDQYQRTILSYAHRIQLALHYSQVRFVYALRTALLLSIAIFIVQYFHLEHGRWLLFTIASISLPYADDIQEKAKKRMIATCIGCGIGCLCFGFISNITLRTVILMISGYTTFYLSDYATTFTCSTVGALGGAITGKVFGVSAVANVVGIRIFYIAIGILIAYVVNVYVYPFNREKATRQLARKYKNTSKLVSEICQKEQMDTQLYYNLIIQIFMQEETLRKNARILKWENINEFLEEIQKVVRMAHRQSNFTS